MARIIDTSVFIELEKNDRELSVLAAGATRESYALASITAAELLNGVARATSSEHRHRRSDFVELVLQSIPVVPFDVAIARDLARIWAELESTGQRIGPYDLIIAATALTHGPDILTFNVREFLRVPGLRVVRPNW